MSQLIGIYDGGFTKDRKGRKVAAIRFKIVTGEGKPDDVTAYCLPVYKVAVFTQLKRLAPLNSDPEGITPESSQEKA